jgi:hypothetical protein
MTRMERYEFTEDERNEIGRKLAQNVALVDRLRQEKKQSAKDLSDQIKAAEKHSAELAAKINSGYEMREVSNQRALAFPQR